MAYTTMLKAVAAVSTELCKICPPHEQTIEMIAAMFKAKTILDEIIFVEYDTPADNPIWGEFTRWRYQPGAYASFNTAAEIRYAKHLLGTENWLRFVITKELCHALEAPQGRYAVENGTLDELATKFSVYSHRRAIGPMSPAYELEVLAEIAAVELLCPVDIREAYIGKNGVPNKEAYSALAVQHKLPLEIVIGAFDSAYNATVRDLMNGR